MVTLQRSLHLLYQYLSPRCEESESGKHSFIVINREEYDPPELVLLTCEKCGTYAYFRTTWLTK